MTAKKTVLKLSTQEARIMKKAFVTVSQFPGVTSITIDDRTGKMTVVGEVDVPVIVMKLRKICYAEIVSLEDVKPLEKKAESDKPAPPILAEVVTFPFSMNYPSYCASSYYHQPYGKVVVEEQNLCVIM